MMLMVSGLMSCCKGTFYWSGAVVDVVGGGGVVFGVRFMSFLRLEIQVHWRRCDPDAVASFPHALTGDKERGRGLREARGDTPTEREQPW